jgi:hypothetical protein
LGAVAHNALNPARQRTFCYEWQTSFFVPLRRFHYHSLRGGLGVHLGIHGAQHATLPRDEDLQFSDWIELHNPGPASVNLNGWYLTDTTNVLTRWRFPATNIAANGYLIVFASSKNRAVAGRELHTSFNLSGNGEYLGLVRPDGVTIASEFAPLFPEQFDNISYGIGQSVTATKLFAATAPAKALVPQDDSAGTNWTAIGFDDSAWTSGPLGVGFAGSNSAVSMVGLYAYWPMREGSGTVASNLVSGGVHGTLNGATWVSDPQRGTVLSFNGTSAYVAAGTIPRLGQSTSNFTWSFWFKQNAVANGNAVILGNRSGGVQSPLQFIKFTPSNFEYYRGAPIGFIPYSVPNGVWRHLCVVKNGSSLTYYANGAVVGSSTAGGDIEANPLFFGGDPGAAGEFSNGFMDDVALWTRALSATEVTALVNGATPLGFSSFIGTDVGASMRGSNGTAYVRVPFNVSEDEAFNRLKLRMRYDDGFVAYLNGTEVARRNAPSTLAWNSSATAAHPDAQALVFEEIDISESVGVIEVGTNVLAIHGLNLSATDADFLIQPELEASHVLTAGQRYFGLPTPGRDNDLGFLGFVGDTKFSHDRGFYDTNFNLTITCDTPGVTIRYTTNGMPPTETTGIIYGGPIPISRTTTLRAAAYRAGYQPSNVDTHSYIYLDNIVAQTGGGFPATWAGVAADYAMDPDVVNSPAYSNTIRNDLKSLPVVSIVMDVNQFFSPTGIYSIPTSQGAAFERPCSAEMFFPDGSQDGFQIDCGIRISGGASRNPGLTPKHGVRLLFKTIYGSSKLRYQFFDNTDVDRFDSIVFRPNFNMSWVRTPNSGPLLNGNADDAERTHALYIRDQWTKDSYTAMGAAGAHERFVHLYINGLYWGLYNPCERTDASFAATYLGGEKEEYDAIFSDLSSTARAVDGDRNAWNAALAVANAGLTTSNAYREIQKWIDVTNLADYMMLNFYCATVDWPWQNWNALRKREANAQFKFIVWDAEYTLDTLPWMPDDRTPNVGAGAGGVNGNDLDSPARFYFHLKNNPEWRQLFGDRAHLHFFNNGVLTTNQTIPRFLGLCDMIDRAIVGESARWGDVRRDPPYTRNAEWLTEKQRLLTNFFAGRTERVVGHLRGAGLYPFLSAPSYSPHGAFFTNEVTVTITAPAGTIYYTTNGADPRLPGGGVAPDATTYAGPITFNGSRRLLARAFHTNVWSAINDAAFIEATPIPVRITEIMFNPEISPGDTNESENFEYIEVKNIGAAPLPLAGMKLTRGVTFNFPNIVLGAGQHALVVNNLAAFQSRYGTSLNVVGEYVGALSDDGENIRLQGQLGEIIHDFEYDEWYPLTDGLGFSLVIVNENAPLDTWNERESWRPSGLLGGSPGADDPAPNIPAIRINEALTHTDLPQIDTIELYNPTGADVDLAGWFLTDDVREPKKYRIPAGTIIAAGGYLTLDESQFDSGPDGFSLSNKGEDVYIYSGDANTNLTGYAHGFSFGAAFRGVSFGRYVISTGEEHFPSQTSYTPNAPNAGPIIGPVVLTEIMYNPPPDGDEFVEVKNISGNSVALYHISHPANTWKINGLNFSFPEGTVLAPGEVALAVSGSADAFRARYGLPSALRIFSYVGSLQDNGENIELQQPDFPDGQIVPYIVVDAVRYNDRSPWPRAADGTGPSLQKIAGNTYGNDPIAWAAAAPSPGVDYAGGQPPVIIAQPASQTARGGTNVTMSVVLGGDAPFFYQWQFNGNRIANGTNETLLLANVQPSDSGNYSVVVYSAAGATMSSNAQLAVLMPPTITAPPTNVLARLANPSATTNVSFRVIATGAGPLSYQWFHNAAAIANATNSILMLSNATTAAAGTYTVEVGDSNGWAYASATLTILVNPVFIEQPQSHIAVEHDTVTFRVKMAGTEPFGYRWRRNSVAIAPFGPDAFYTITDVTTNQAGTYTVVVTNAALTGGTLSAGAVLRVEIDTDMDHAPDSWEMANGFDRMDPNDMGDDDDADADTMTNLEEYIAGTDPRDAQSYFKVDTISRAPNTLLTFMARSNRTYTVQYNSDLSINGWSNLSNVLYRATNRVETVVDPSPAAGRVYRLVTPLQ